MTAPPPEAIGVARASLDGTAVELRPVAPSEGAHDATSHQPYNIASRISGEASRSMLKMPYPSSASDPLPGPEHASSNGFSSGYARRASSSQHPETRPVSYTSHTDHADHATPTYPPSAPVSGTSTPGISTGTGTGAESITDPLFAQSLLPVDGGRHAWLFLVGATVIEVLVYGFSFSIGVLHLHWTQVMFGPQHLSTITLASTLQAGMLYLTLGLVGP